MKKFPLNFFILFFLFLSGIAGLIYQVVWTRMLLLVFGVGTVSIVIVVVTFMLGLASGSWFFGKLSEKIKKLLMLYGFLELGIGITAGLSPVLISKMMDLYRFFYWQTSSFDQTLILKIIFSGAVIFLPTFFMGGTVPILIKFIQNSFGGNLSKNLGQVYATNTLGAFVGVLLSAFLLIEVIGLSGTVWIGVFINLAVAVAAVFWARNDNKIVTNSSLDTKSTTLTEKYGRFDKLMVFIAIFFSGFLSLAYEILWTRLLTPIVGTYIYAFATILAIYLLGIVFGAFIFQRFIPRLKNTLYFLGIVQIGIAIGALSSIFIVSTFYPQYVFLITSAVIFPTTLLMGIGFPAFANLTRKLSESGSFVGKIYAVNTLGALLGPIIAGFVLIPFLGTGKSILILAGINIFLGLCLTLCEGKDNSKTKGIIVMIGTILLVVTTGFSVWKPNYFYQKNLKAYLGKFKLEPYNYSYKEDQTASVLAFKKTDETDSGLLVDGVGITILVDDTKLMAHLPLLLHPDPKNALVVAFGMGTTFRSAMSHQNLFVDAVDLVPSVPKMFPIFFSNATKITADPRGKIYIDDGRNFVFLTKKKYDVITVDPPPPVNSAGTTVLYSRDFYDQSKRILNDGGLFMEWVTLAREDDFKMLIKSFVDEFPYVLAFSSPRKAGVFLIGSERKIEIDQNKIGQRLIKEIFSDLNEWGKWEANDLVKLYITDRDGLVKYIGNVNAVTDNYPRTEYFLLRQNLTYSPNVEIEALEKFRKLPE